MVRKNPILLTFELLFEGLFVQLIPVVKGFTMLFIVI